MVVKIQPQSSADILSEKYMYYNDIQKEKLSSYLSNTNKTCRKKSHIPHPGRMSIQHMQQGGVHFLPVHERWVTGIG